MIIYNGFKPNEVRVSVLKPRKRDKGHSVVKVVTTRPGEAFNLTYKWHCQCGKVIGSKRSVESIINRHTRHLKDEGVI